MDRRLLVNRRTALAFLSSGALWRAPDVHAQSGATPVIGFFDSGAATPLKLAAFYDGLKTEGFIRNQNVIVVNHSAEGEYRRLALLVGDLIDRKVAIIAASGLAAVKAAQATKTAIPIIFATGSEPVDAALVDNLQRPGGTISGVTGVMSDGIKARLQIARELLPTAASFGLLVNSSNRIPDTEIQAALATARENGSLVQIDYASDDHTLDSAFARFAQSKVQASVIQDDDFFESRSEQLATLALHHSLPTVFQHRAFVDAGGLISYGSSPAELFHQLGVWVGLVMKGADPAKLPVYRASQIECLCNVKTAKILGISIPDSILGRAHKVLQ